MKRIRQILIFLTVVLVFAGCSKKHTIHPYVDLGLPSGTLWATYNVGGATSTDVGALYAWGETEPKKDYSWENYKWGQPNNLKKYCDQPFEGNNDLKQNLDSDDDAATENWGEEWRMPTEREMKELVEECKWQWTDNYGGSGVRGFLGISKYNGQMIFLPATTSAPNADGSDFSVSSYYTNQRSSEPGSNYAYVLSFDKQSFPIISSSERMEGQCVRAVLCKKSEQYLQKSQDDLAFFISGNQSNVLEANQVADFNVIGNYAKQTLTVSGRSTSDWELKCIDTLVHDSVLYMMVKGTDKLPKNKTDNFEMVLNINEGIKEVRFGNLHKCIWTRKSRPYTNPGRSFASFVKVIESTELCPFYRSIHIEGKNPDRWYERFKDTSDFKSRMPEGYIYNGIFSTCDVNKDGLTDYLLEIEGPYENGRPSMQDFIDGVEYANRGIMLVINGGDYYYSDVWNNNCFFPKNDDETSEGDALKLDVSANNDSLEIGCSDGNTDFWTYKFVYRNSNYEIVEFSEESMCRGPITTYSRTVNVDKGYDIVRYLKTDFPYKNGNDLEELPDDNAYEYTKFAIKNVNEINLTNIKSFY